MKNNIFTLAIIGILGCGSVQPSPEMIAEEKLEQAQERKRFSEQMEKFGAKMQEIDPDKNPVLGVTSYEGAEPGWIVVVLNDSVFYEPEEIQKQFMRSASLTWASYWPEGNLINFVDDTGNNIATYMDGR